MAQDITDCLQDLRDGDASAVDRLMPLIYSELREMASQRMRRERGAHTLGTTALVNEVYLRFRKQRRLDAEDRAEFLAAAANTMRRVLVDYGRRRRSLKRGAGREPVPLEAVEPFLRDDELEDLLGIDEALTRLAAINPEGAMVVQYRFFAGLTQEEIAEVTRTSTRTVRRRWLAARAWLRKEIDGANLSAL